MIENEIETTKTERVEVNEWVYLEGSTIHGMGGFARKRIPAKTRLLEYVGEKISKAEAAKRCADGNTFIFVLDEETDLDGNVDWNPARLLNHSCDPNCESEWDEGQIWLESKRVIEKGEELSFDYCYDLEDWKEHPCHCGASNCRGYIISEELYATVLAKEGVPA